MKKHYLKLFLFGFLAITACKSNTDSDNDSIVLNGVYVLNEGNFGKANASITVYNPITGAVSQNQYQTINGAPVGDLLHSVTEIEGKLYLVVNNSNKIEVVNKETFTKVATIDIANQASPRYLVPVSESKAYVTNLYGNSVSVINLVNNEEETTIPVGLNPEGIVAVGNRAYVANSGFGNGNTLSVLDTENDVVIDSISVGDNPTYLVKQSNNNIWVVCVGAYNDFSTSEDDTPGEIFVLNGVTGEVISSIEVGGHPGDLVLNENDGIAYLINGSSVMKIDMSTFEIMDANFINRSFYSLGFSTTDDSNYLWGADAKNFAQSGVAIQYNINGVKVDSFATGIIPGSFYFDSE